MNDCVPNPNPSPSPNMNATQPSLADAPRRPPSARELRDAFAEGRLALADVHADLGARALQAQQRIEPFAALDERVVAAQLRRLEDEHARGLPPGPLFGVPVGVKDIIDTADFPTAHGSPIHAGRQPAADATVVRRLRAAGAVIFAKTVTTEFATFVPSRTLNPHDPAHTPGGSSSGSAAAVAAGVLPLAVGTQTNGSVIRPASFCGVYAYKPTRGWLPRTGVFDQSPSLDQIGVFARCVEDLALAVEVMAGDDGHDAASRGLAPRRLLQTCLAEPPVPPRIGFVRTPYWEEMEPEARAACEAFVERLQGLVTVTELPAVVPQTAAWHRTINDVELAHALRRELAEHPEAIDAALREKMTQAMHVSAVDYLRARAAMAEVERAFDDTFARFDLLVGPAALGAAPRGLASTGNPIMQTVSSFAGLPSVALPLLQGARGLPLGLQAVAAAHDDARLLRGCRWLVQRHAERLAG
jgi:Asp-tRNA(Asn)/Glu-tRNA(Gln) amidotransferase A subunit family amidase